MKKIYLASFMMLLSLGNINAQNPQIISTHQEHMAQFGDHEKVASKFDVGGKGILPFKKSQAKSLSKMVFGFLPDWEYNNGAHSNMHYDLLTHLAAFDFAVASNGSISNPSGWPWTDVINGAHNAGTKVIMTAVNFNGTEIHTILTNTTVKNKFKSEVKRIISTFNLDGVNVDFEGLNTADRGSLLNNFMTELTTYIHTELPGKEVSFDGPSVNWSGWDLDGLTQSVDYVFIMAYDYHGGWSDNTGAVSPLTHPSGGISQTKTLTNDYSVPKSKYPEKLILGVPYYGKHWVTATSAAGSAVTSYVGSTFYKNDILNAVTKGGYIWDDASQTPWYKWQSGSWNQIWSDNETSLGKKYDLALTHNLGGVGIWALNYDGNRSELWSLISTKFGGTTTPIPSAPTAAAALRKNATTITLKFKAGNHAESYEVLQSTDNTTFTLIKEAAATSIDITGLTQGEVYYFKVRSKNSSGSSSETEVIAAMPSLYKSDFLIVDGLSRRSFDAIIQYDDPLTQLGRTFSNASASAIINGIVDMKEYKFAIWMFLDESSTQDTFNKEEQTKVKEFIDNNGVFIVSGSEIGWDLGNDSKADAVDMSFYENYLKAAYIEDAPANSKATYYTAKDTSGNKYNFDNGTHGITDISWPDEITPVNGSTTSFTYDGYSGSGVAGVSYQNGNGGGVEYLAFPIEAVYDHTERKDLLNSIFQKYSAVLAAADSFIKTNINLYPNPTKDVLKIANPNHIRIQKVTLFNMYGQRLKTVQNQNNIDLTSFKSGIYMIKIEDEQGKQGIFKAMKN